MEGSPGNSEGMAGLLLCEGEEAAGCGRSVSDSEREQRGVTRRRGEAPTGGDAVCGAG